MGSTLAFLICGVGIAGLFFLDRDKSVRTSAALWLPVIWFWIAGSRPISMWLGIGGSGQGALNASLDGSPTDAIFFEVLIFAGVLVLYQRRKSAWAFLAASVPLLVYYFYCLCSVAWSPFHDPAFKRWTKYAGDLIMVLIILTEAQPRAALRRIFTRVGFVFLPLSVVFTRYTDMGRGYDPSGDPANIGVSTNKNMLGLVTFVILIGVLWSLRALLADKDAPNRSRRLIAQFTLLAFAVYVLQMAHCATAVACALLGGGLLLATSLPAFRNRPARLHALVLTIVLGGGLMMLFGGESVVTSALGRNPDLTGRTEIWAASISAADNRLIGTGFESFWNANNSKVARALPGYWDLSDLVTAHNGYIEIYLNLGWVGVCLIAIVLVSGYLRVGKAYQRDPELGSLFLAYIAAGAIYAISEAGFRVLTPSWFFLTLGIVGAGGIVVGVLGADVKVPLVASTQLHWAKPVRRKFALSGEGGRFANFARRTEPATGANIASDDLAGTKPQPPRFLTAPARGRR
jgi:exopolysaccharide production protein ExoQ